MRINNFKTDIDQWQIVKNHRAVRERFTKGLKRERVIWLVSNDIPLRLVVQWTRLGNSERKLDRILKSLNLFYLSVVAYM